MSPTKKDRNLRSISGRSFRVPLEDGRLGANGYALAIASALHKEYGGTHAAVKTVVENTGANARAVKNWFDAKNGPSGELLIALCRHSEEVLETVLQLAGRQELITAKQLVRAKEKLRDLLSYIDQLEQQNVQRS